MRPSKPAVICLAVALVGCGNDTTKAADSDAHLADASGTVIDRDQCRPVAQAWTPGTPLRLPCEPTVEACNEVDDDNDGITDPHCETPCASDADCTFGGLVLDADCNDHADGQPACSFIDGTPSTPDMLKCRGMLCPPQTKCVAGECVAPGTGVPFEACDDGTECPTHAGCIPSVFGDFETGVCVHYCQHVPCPTGSACVTPPEDAVTHSVCFPLTRCAADKSACAEWSEQCIAVPDCALAAACHLYQSGDCPPPGPAQALLECIESTCGAAAPP